MTFDLRDILASKRAFRHALAARDIGEKLRMLDALRERAVILRSSRSLLALREKEARHGATPLGFIPPTDSDKPHG